MIDHIELKRLAEAATKGEWTRDARKFGGVVYGGPIQHWVNGSGQSQVAMTTGAEWMRPGETEENADFIAAANPAVILELLAEIERPKGGQGEPVAWIKPKTLEALTPSGMVYVTGFDIGGSIALYTSKPAPVSAVEMLSEIIDSGQLAGILLEDAIACLDKVKELNQ